MNESGTGTPGTDAVDPPTPDVGPASVNRTAARWGTRTLAVLAVAWLAGILWSAHAAIAGSPDVGLVALAQAALALPGVVAASLVAGAAAGLVTVELVARRWRLVASHGAAALATGLAGGLVIGAACAGLVLAAYGLHSPIVVLATAVGAAGTLGGALGAVRPDGVVGAAIAGTLAWNVIGLLQAAYSSRLLRLFGAGGTLASQYRAASRLSLTMALIGGALAGLVAYGYLRRRGADLRWPAYLAAGAGPGALIGLGGLVTQIGGAQLLGLASSVSAEDAAALSYLNTSSVNTALIMLFTGAVTAIVAFGRTLPPAQATAEPAGGPAEPAGGTAEPTGGPAEPAGDRGEPAGTPVAKPTTGPASKQASRSPGKAASKRARPR